MKLFKISVQIGLGVLVAGAVLTGCGNLSELESLQSSSEVASGNMAAVAIATENNGSFATSLFSVSGSLFAAPPSGGGQSSDSAACRELREAADCSAHDGVIQMALDLCKRGRAQWKGIEQLAFSAQAVCEARLHSRGVPVSGSVVRTFIGVIGDTANPATFRQEGPRKWSYDSTTAYGYAEAVSGGTQVQFGLDESGLLPLRTVTIRGLRVVAEGAPPRGQKPFPGGVGEGKQRGEGVEQNPPRESNTPSSGQRPPERQENESGEGKPAMEVKWDHSISNDAAHPVKIVGSGKDKKILAGGVTKVQHNLNQFTSTTVIEEALVFAEGCCHPVSGKVSTTFTADKAGVQRAPESLRFTSQCGVAELTASDASTASLQLKGCF